MEFLNEWSRLYLISHVSLGFSPEQDPICMYVCVYVCMYVYLCVCVCSLTQLKNSLFYKLKTQLEYHKLDFHVSLPSHLRTL